jgi:hypothetical protein
MTKIHPIVLAAITLFFLITITGCTQSRQKGGFKEYTIDTSLQTKLNKAKLNSNLNFPNLDNGFWAFFDDLLLKEYFKDLNPLGMLDTIQELSDVPCDCMIKNDTIFIQGGIAYEGGIGFDLKIVKNKFEGQIWIFGIGYRTDPSKPFEEEISLKSIHQTMKIQSVDSLKPGSKLIGEIVMESEEYFKKDVSKPNKFYMKVLFGCRLDDFIGF